MDISLTPELEQFIHAQVQSGKFTSPLAVIEAGIRLLEERERIYQGRFEELRQEVLIGIEELDRGETIEGEVVFQQLRDKLQQRRVQAEQ